MPWQRPLPEPDAEFVGKTLEQAKEMADEANLQLRIVEKDGQGMCITCECRPYRVNIVVVGDVITGISPMGRG